jgi:hypothetical protein
MANPRPPRMMASRRTSRMIAMRLFLMSLREPAVWQTPGVVAAGR